LTLRAPRSSALFPYTTRSDLLMRGRVLALYIAVFMAGVPIGAPLLGWCARELGPRSAIGLGAVGGLVAFAIGATFLIQRRRSEGDRKSTRLNSSHVKISYAVF